MINLFGKDKLCEMTGQPQVLTFEGQLNPTIMRNITKKVQKVISRFKDTLFGVSPVRYTIKEKAAGQEP